MKKTTTANISGVSRVGLILLALGGGVVGGFVQGVLTHTASAQTDSPGLIRASSVELVDSSGRRVGFLGPDEHGSTALVFFNAQGKKRAEFGLYNREAPRLSINGPDGDSLLSLDLGENAKPRLIMSEHNFNGRVYLGVAEPDAPDPAWKYDAWVLRFRGDRAQPLATLGMTTGGAGGVAIFDQAGRQWRARLK